MMAARFFLRVSALLACGVAPSDVHAAEQAVRGAEGRAHALLTPCGTRPPPGPTA
jgi:hypothetical protein